MDTNTFKVMDQVVKLVGAERTIEIMLSVMSENGTLEKIQKDDPKMWEQCKPYYNPEFKLAA